MCQSGTFHEENPHQIKKRICKQCEIDSFLLALYVSPQSFTEGFVAEEITGHFHQSSSCRKNVGLHATSWLFLSEISTWPRSSVITPK